TCYNWPRRAWSVPCAKTRRWLRASTSARGTSRIPRWQRPLGWSASRSCEDDMAAPLVAILMGSDSDLPTVREACAVLDTFGVPFEARVLSAHRSPED